MKQHIVPTTTLAFTLVEVLVAVLIVALTLTTAITAVEGMTRAAYSMDERTLALWSADNILQAQRIEKTGLTPGKETVKCPQGHYAFECAITVAVSSNPRFYWVRVHVLNGEHQLASLTYLVDREAR